MKYFSPAILDGSVTTVKIADGAVIRSKLSNPANSQSGSIGILGRVSVALNDTSFFPDIEGDESADAALNMHLLADFKAVPVGSATAPQFDLFNGDTGFARNYSVVWSAVGG